MKKIIIFFLLISTNLYGVEIESRWNDFFQKEITTTCSEDHGFCEEVCGDKYFCVIKEKPCRNCMGTSVQMHHIFQNIGRIYVSREEVTNYELRDLLSSKNFSTITSKSVFNNVSRFNNFSLRGKFMSLCPGLKVKYPIVFFDVNETSKRLGDVRYVACQRPGEELKVFRMVSDGNTELFFEDDSEIEIDENDEFLFM